MRHHCNHLAAPQFSSISVNCHCALNGSLVFKMYLAQMFCCCLISGYFIIDVYLCSLPFCSSAFVCFQVFCTLLIVMLMCLFLCVCALVRSPVWENTGVSLMFHIPSTDIKGVVNVCVLLPDGSCHGQAEITYRSLPSCTNMAPSSSWIRYAQNMKQRNEKC